MKIKDLMPKIYEVNTEMNAILDAEQLEINDSLEIKVRTSFENTFIATADEDGITQFEKLFGITANPEEESLDFRRARLYNRINTSPIYTETWLKSKLNEVIGDGAWRYDIDYNEYTLDIYILRPGKAWLNELQILLTKVMPCNIVWTIHIYTISWLVVKENTQKWSDVSTMTWQEVMEGEWVDG